MTEVLLKIDALQKGFGEERVLKGAALEIAPHSITTIVGKSGIGKSVLMKCVAGLLRPDAGSISWRGEGVFPKERSARWRNEIGYLFQGDTLFEHLTVEENVVLPLTESTGRTVPHFRKQCRDLLETLDLVEVSQSYPNVLSGGMRRRVALARCLIQEPELVLFDEPTTGLDPVRSQAVFDMIRQKRDDHGFSALIVSHDLPASLDIADDSYVLKGGVLEKIDNQQKLSFNELL